jgi:hypothetical protein
VLAAPVEVAAPVKLVVPVDVVVPAVEVAAPVKVLVPPVETVVPPAELVIPPVELVIPLAELLAAPGNSALPPPVTTAPFDVSSDQNPVELGAWMLAIARAASAPGCAATNPIASGGAITIPMAAAARSIR